MEAVLFVVLTLTLFLFVWAVTRMIGSMDLGGWILGITEPFVQPADTDEPRPLRLMAQGSPQPGVTPSGSRDLVILSMTADTIRSRRQSHRRQFCEDMMDRQGTVPHPKLADRWWPGTTWSEAEKEYAR